MRTWIMALAILLLAPTGASADVAPLTREEVETLPPRELARRLLGPTGDLMVGMRARPRSPFGGEDLTFFSEPRVHGVLCAASFVTVRVEIQPGRPEVRPTLIWSNVAYLYPAQFDVKPIDQDAIDAYCKTLDPLTFHWGESAHAQDIGRFLTSAIREAQGEGPVSFDLECSQTTDFCTDPREHLAQLSIERITGHGLASCQQRWTDRRRVICYRISIDPPDARRGLKESVEIGVADNWEDRRVLFVSIYRDVPPPPVH